MFRRRTTLSLSAAAATTLALPLLAGCGGEPRAGAAAVVDGDRISVTQVQSKSEQVRRAQRATEDSERLISGTAWLNRATLDTMIRYRIIERLAEDAGVSVSRREVQRARADAERNVGGKEQLEQMLLQQRPLAPEQIDADMRMQLLLEKVARSLGVQLQSPQGQQVLRKRLSEVSQEMDVTVSPRFGEWDDEQLGLAETREPWLKELSDQGDKLA